MKAFLLVLDGQHTNHYGNNNNNDNNTVVMSMMKILTEELSQPFVLGIASLKLVKL